MQPSRSRISPKVLLELTEKLHQDDPSTQKRRKMHPLVQLYQKWSIVLVCGAWLLMLAAAPIFLFLMLFGPKFNFTGQWVITAAWLLAGSFIVGGLLPIAIWADQFIHGDRPTIAHLLAGIAIVASTISGVILISQMTNEDFPPLLTVGISVLLGMLFIGWAVYRLFTEDQTSIVFRLLFLVASLCFSVGLISTAIALKQEELAITPVNYRALQALNGVLSPIGWFALIISNLSPLATRNIQWDKQAIVRLGLFGIVLILLLLLLLTR